MDIRCGPSDVRFGSKADMCSARAHVRFTPESDIKCDVVECPLWAKSGHANLMMLATCNRISDRNRQSGRVCPISVGPAKMLLGSLSAPASQGFLPTPL